MMHSLSTQVHKTMRSPRRFGIISVLLLLGLILYVYTVAPTIRGAVSVVEYNDFSQNDVVWIEPETDVLCPGDVLRYNVDISLAPANGQAVVEIVEGWCLPGQGCPRAFQATPFMANNFEAVDFSTGAVREVPALPAGVWEYRHSNITKSENDQGVAVETMSGYRLEVTVPSHCAQ